MVRKLIVALIVIGAALAMVMYFLRVTIRPIGMGPVGRVYLHNLSALPL